MIEGARAADAQGGNPLPVGHLFLQLSDAPGDTFHHVLGAIVCTGGDSAAGHDAISRIDEACGGFGRAQIYAYDPIGHRSSLPNRGYYALAAAGVGLAAHGRE